MVQSSQINNAIEVFFSYAHADRKLRDEPEKHLSLMARQGLISEWYDRNITAGKEWAVAIDSHLNAARLILLLISSDFLYSDYCYSIEMKCAMTRHENGDALVVPIILRDVDWHSSPFGKLQALPTDGKPVTSWPNQDEAFADVVRGLRRAITEITPKAEQTFRIRWQLTLNARIDDIDLQKVQNIISELQRLSDDSSIRLKRIDPGSIILILEGTREGFERIQSLFREGNLIELSGIEIQNLQLRNEDTSENPDQTLSPESIDPEELVLTYIQKGQEYEGIGNTDIAQEYFDNAFRILIEFYYDDIESYGRRRLTYHQDADDILQIVFLSIWRALPRFRPLTSKPPTIRPWLMRITKSVLIDALRAENRASKLSEHLTTEIQYNQRELEMALNPENIIEQYEYTEQRKILISRAIEELPRRLYRIFALRFISRFTYREIAEILHIPEHVVRRHYSECIKHLRRYIENQK